MTARSQTAHDALSAPQRGTASITAFLMLANLVILMILSGCAQLPAGSADPERHKQTLPTGQPPLISASPAGRTVPLGWHEWILLRTKRKTEYMVESVDGVNVVSAKADASASGMFTPVDIDPAATPFVSWRWRISNLLEGADLTDMYASDSPVRIALGFEGDKGSLPLRDQLMFEQVKLLTGEEMPYASLVYVWSNSLPLESIHPNTRTGRVQKLVVNSGAAAVGQWQSFTRNVAEDYVRAFGTPPGRLTRVAIMTDADNTRTSVRAWYGDIRFSPTGP